MARMSAKQLAVGAGTLAADAVFLLVVGAVMMSEPPSPATEAVGMGLIALSGACAIPAFVLLMAYLDAIGLPRNDAEPARSHWEEA